MVERTAEGSLFHKEGPMDAKDLDWAIEVMMWGTKRSSWSEDQRGRWAVAEKRRRMTSQRYFGVSLSWAKELKWELWIVCDQRQPLKLFSHECRDVGESRKMGYQFSSSVNHRLYRR